MEEEIKLLMFNLIKELKFGIDSDPIYFIIYPDLVKLLEEYYTYVLIDNKSTHLRMKHLLDDIMSFSDKLSSKTKINNQIKSLTAKLIKFHRIIFEFNYTMRLEASHYKNDVWSFLKSEYKIKKLLVHSLYQARHCTTHTVMLADKVDSDWKDIWNQLSEKSTLIDRVVDIHNRNKNIDLMTVFKPMEDSFIVIDIATSTLINRIESLMTVKNLTKLDKHELRTAIEHLNKFKSMIPKVREYHHNRLEIIEEYKRIHFKYNS